MHRKRMSSKNEIDPETEERGRKRAGMKPSTCAHHDYSMMLYNSRSASLRYSYVSRMKPERLELRWVPVSVSECGGISEMLSTRHGCGIALVREEMRARARVAGNMGDGRGWAQCGSRITDRWAGHGERRRE